MRTTAALRTLLKQSGAVMAPGAHDALAARIIEQAGFDVVYFTGYGQAASYLGKPDVGLLTMTEMATRVANIADAVGIPLIADGDTGFGNHVNVMRTVRQYEKAGAAAIQLEDQVFPKRCGHMLGRQVIAVDDMVSKIKAAVDARRDEDFVIIARTDARTSQGLEAAIDRGYAYQEAGADLLFIESPESVDEMRQIASSFSVPLLANMVEGGRTPLLTAAELGQIGYRIVIYPTASVYAVARTLMDLMSQLKAWGTTRGFIDRMVTFSEFNQLVGLAEIADAERRYSPHEACTSTRG